MTDTWIYILIALGGLILAGLAFYAGKLLFQLKAQTQAVEAAKQKRDNKIIESIQTIAQAVEQEQCEVSEGALRLAVLFDHLSDSTTADYPKRYPAVHQLNEKIKHLDVLEARKALPKQERMKQDVIRLKAEAEHKEAVMTEANLISQFSMSA
ncbi:DUF2489 domain-containing protein [Catenovulum sp. 2E275]|uniref:DUF2489 domain-containing protein n=1 Tax=Catenovulum sp. 2E275 TaxID=2980497 RepID=UPI0021D21B99|nr:DUF2489 domain-containing protein [Catenovulum sp. 2E275]MCU4675865.1 DUF2489 domain-containing protein [Catenovulum sp. 2E275]